ncbi:hypothetical protein LSH36_232g03046 [Paralvinella palmiformis]|uniref:Uncharacterized protein n=1 Tax=Paralvinella palmiformis TaxID=53620 RepID=A0AAD9JM61_9ANNE|nr:hypothetical protein LSH36_232g03046 [Paralvinella palmiformis]
MSTRTGERKLLREAGGGYVSDVDDLTPISAVSFRRSFRSPLRGISRRICYKDVLSKADEVVTCSQLGGDCRNVTCPTWQPCLLIGYRVDKRHHVVSVYLGDELTACACGCSSPEDRAPSEEDAPIKWSACEQLALSLSNLNISQISETDSSMTRKPSHHVSNRITPAHFQTMTLSHSRQVTSASLGMLRQVLRKLTTKTTANGPRSDGVTPKAGSNPSYSRLLQEKFIEKDLIEKNKDDLDNPELVVYDQSALSGSTIAMFVIILVIIMIAIILSFYSK